MKTERMISCEYPTVLKRSCCRGLLETVHGIKVNKEAALEVIFVYLDEEDILGDGIRFTGFKGGGCCEYHNKNGLFRQVTIKLPTEESGHLTLGVVLHEIAHALNYIDHNDGMHSDSFVAILDYLIMSEWYYEEEQEVVDYN